MQPFSLISFFLLLLWVPLDILAYEGPLPPPPQRRRRLSRHGPPEGVTRRSLMTTTSVLPVAGAVAMAVGVFPSGAIMDPKEGIVVIKVTHLAHTFIITSSSSSSGTAVKPIRENDATRFITNAKVVYLFQGKDDTTTTKKSNHNHHRLATEVLEWTVQRKAGKGPGVTPGKVKLLSSDQSLADVAAGLGIDVVVVSVQSESVDAVVAVAKTMTEGDVLVVGPISSRGVASDGRLLAETAQGLGTFVGAKTGRGVLSVLLDGPREGLHFIESGYPISDLLWYSIQ